LEDLTEEGIVVGDKALPDDADDSDGINITFSDDENDVNCDLGDFESADMPDWLASRMTPERLQVVCDRVIADGGRALFDKLRDNVPAALFFLLPLMALILKIMYPLSKRYYVEHLLFVVHYHAFFFLILTLQILFARFTLLVGIPENAIDIVLIGAAIYIPVYLFRSMQRVYGQGLVITALKFIFLGIAYFVGFFLTMSIAALFAALSI